MVLDLVSDKSLESGRDRGHPVGLLVALSGVWGTFTRTEFLYRCLSDNSA
jgi:hypothetical protein